MYKRISIKYYHETELLKNIIRNFSGDNYKIICFVIKYVEKNVIKSNYPSTNKLAYNTTEDRRLKKC